LRCQETHGFMIGSRSNEVCLVNMPFVALERPSIALSILKAALTADGIRSRVHYANLEFADIPGAHLYDYLCNSPSNLLVGEWIFSAAAFPDFHPDRQAFFEHVIPGLNYLEPLARAMGFEISEILSRIRAVAFAFTERQARSIVQSGARVVGCTSTFQQHCASLALLRRIKELDPSIFTVIGGANCDGSMGVVTHRECTWLDFVISGEADLAFPRLCHYLLGLPDRSKSDLSQTGVIGPEQRLWGYSEMLRKPPRARLDQMDRSPVPDYDDYFNALKSSPISAYVNPGLLIETSRGCWWGEVSHCTFCGLNGASMSFRSKSAERVVAEFTGQASRYGIRGFEVVDNILDMAYFKTVIPRLAVEEPGFDIFYETKANLTREHLRLLADAGVRWLQPGIESLDDGVLRAIAKGTRAHLNLQLLKWAQETGIAVLWVMLYDIPGESDEAYERMAQWLPKISHLQPPGTLSFIQYSRFSPYHSRAGDFGLRLAPEPSYAHTYPWGAESLESSAYFFVDSANQRENIDGDLDEGITRPGLRQVRQAIAKWQEDWFLTDAGKPEFYYEPDEGGGLLITDSRCCAVRPRFELRGLSRALYEICDRACKAHTILQALPARGYADVAWADIEPLLHEMLGNNLMLQLEDGHYFSLAFCGKPAELPAPLRRPGGRLRSIREAKELLDAAEARPETLRSTQESELHF
jgi:ribosomal peptide maturation radical SAM protein 1